MTYSVKNVLLTLLALILLGAMTLAVPLGSLTEDAQRAYLNEPPANEEDAYAFLFGD